MSLILPLIIIGLALGYGLYITLKLRNDIDGKIVIITDDEGKKMFSLELDMDPDEIEKRQYIRFKVTDAADEDLD
jgi:hypothetical protein